MIKQFDEIYGNMFGDDPITDTDTPVKLPKQSSSKFHDLAEKLQKQIDEKLSPRQTNTPKRLKQAKNAELEGLRLKRTQQALYKLAELVKLDQVPEALTYITNKKQVYELCRSKTEPIENGYHGYLVDIGEPYGCSLDTIAMWELLTPPTEKEIRDQEIKDLTEAVQFLKIPGYFPTPKAVIAAMTDRVPKIKDSHKMLEPQAGSGAICDYMHEQYRLDITGYELNNTLRLICTHKGHFVEQADFLSIQPSPVYDLVMMNPPFENQVDIQHVMHAYGFLKEYGYLVAIMGPGFTYRGNNRSKDFKSWLDSKGGTWEELPQGAFKESGTGVNSVLVTICKG